MGTYLLDSVSAPEFSSLAARLTLDPGRSLTFFPFRFSINPKILPQTTSTSPHPPLSTLISFHPEGPHFLVRTLPTTLTYGFLSRVFVFPDFSADTPVDSHSVAIMSGYGDRRGGYGGGGGGYGGGRGGYGGGGGYGRDRDDRGGRNGYGGGGFGGE